MEGAYYRVSTNKQGKAGLGLDARHKAVLDYLDGGKWEWSASSPRSKAASAAIGRNWNGRTCSLDRPLSGLLVGVDWKRESTVQTALFDPNRDIKPIARYSS